jgi:1,4-dihydroxy-2-naphthoyl-CoA hydrolase
MQITAPHHVSEGFDGLYGLVFTEISPDTMRGEVSVRDELLQPAGLVHGGVYAAVAESLASTGTYLAVRDDGQVAMGLSNLTSFMRPITDGTIHAIARRRHRGRTTWVWEVEILDDDERLCVLSRVTVAVRDAPQRTTGPSASSVATHEGAGPGAGPPTEPGFGERAQVA